MAEKARGSRAEVLHGTAKRTSGGLTRDDLKKNKNGRIVSAKRSAAAKARPLPAAFAAHQFPKRK
jgi:hypothetical protein